jgi:hypothetical protein
MGTEKLGTFRPSNGRPRELQDGFSERVIALVRERYPDDLGE